MSHGGSRFRFEIRFLEERNRLAQLYAAISDGELRELARETESLTEEARDGAGFGDVERREITTEEKGEADDSSEASAGRAEFRDLLTIRQFRDLPEALLAKSVLDRRDRMLPGRL